MTSSRDHLVSLGPGWSLWRWIWLRGAGFPARGLLALGSDAVVEHLDAEQAAVDRLRVARASALDASRAAATEQVTMLVTANQVPAKNTNHPAVDACLAELRAADAELKALRARTADVVARERARIAGAMRAVGGDPLFREALTWQNRNVLHNAVDTLLRAPAEEDDAKTRERQRLLAKYFQRYSVKNDTIGFFGPSAWVELDRAAEGFEMTPGPTLFAERRVSFEAWAIEALASVLSERPELGPIFVPRRKPFSRLDGRLLHLPPAPPRPLSETDAYFLARADGKTRAREIAHAAAADPASGVATVEDAYRELARLAQQGFVSRAIDIPADLEHPERWLRRELDQLEDPAVRSEAQAPLDQLVTARDAVARAAGDPAALDLAVTALEREFAAITSLAVKRGHGKSYAGRQIFYEDCLRSIDLTIGRGFLDELEPPLGLILTSARWYTWEIARRFRATTGELHRKLVERDGDRRVPLSALLVAMGGLFTGDQYRISPFVAEVQGELHRRWERILEIDRVAPGTRSIQLRSAELRAGVEAAFTAPCPGWPRARYHSPDMMIAARDAAAVAAGDYLAVLGELHCGTNTLLARAAYRLHHDREAVKAAWDRDMGRVCIAPVLASADRSTHLPVSDTRVVRSWPSCCRSCWRSARARPTDHPAAPLTPPADGCRSSPRIGRWRPAPRAPRSWR